VLQRESDHARQGLLRGKPLTFVEAKWGDEGVAPGLRCLKQRFPNVDAWQVSAIGKDNFVSREEFALRRQSSYWRRWCERPQGRTPSGGYGAVTV
jgi:hypothetical protein